MAATRRNFILGSMAAGGALVVGWSVLPPRQRLQTAVPLAIQPGQAAFNGWVKIATDGAVTVIISKSEMGQGVLTSLSMLLADELDADWTRVTYEMSPIDKIYNNVSALVDGLPFHPDNQGLVRRAASHLTAKTVTHLGVMMTGGSSSVKDLWLPMREAGAAARQMLLAAAAQGWEVAQADCRTEKGQVLGPSGQIADYGDLVAKAALLAVPSSIQLKSPDQFKLIGQSTHRLESTAKITGAAKFGIDALPEGLLYAAVQMCPTLGGRVASFDAAQVSAMPGVRHALTVEPLYGGTGGVAVIAGRPWQAQNALKGLEIAWDHGALASFNSSAVMAQLTQTLDNGATGFSYYSTGDVDAALQSAARIVNAEYQAPYLAHATMEPMNCTVLLKEGQATVWVSTQVPSMARSAVAKVLDLPPEAVTVHVMLLGGGFGRRLEVDFIAQAARIARAAEGFPVQTMWTREQDMRHDFYRPACVSRFGAGLNEKNQLVAWKNTSAGQAIVPQVLKRGFGLPGGGPDKTTSEGAFDQPYEWPAARIAHEAVDLPLQVGFWRAVGHSHQAFFKECFLDEVAHAVQADPVAYRASLLQRHPRHLAVLQRVAELSRWGESIASVAGTPARARGVALHESFGSIVAQVAEVSLRPDNSIRVHEVWCVIDCGLAVNPQLIEQQLESGIVYGLSAALHGEIHIVNGQVQASNFHDQPALRMNDCPAIRCVIMPSTEPPEGVGEPGLPPIAPAVANALFTLTGQRLRSLPLRIA
ncbi:xanthine dehydrogenase family protein molybdopterin-binding subunit [Hydrogenophaga sp.]|uniref:xanthine dehydrogenase family protein molybdopterin-binding subunit n=1 Tax=Hydrogenophaga sp. TaxID=1904254 RepID=UPI0027168BFD|nr:xanthine dehydrogenase family protein molybdopterin-binding subunit [Hydrogenophaga sp.]MDO8906388.1 xanthine dehydrogenase family protein molybdopterin-binding subunit [Hydrogenophaga sp.]